MSIIRIFIGMAIGAILLYLGSMFLSEHPKQPQPVTKVYTLPEKYSLLKNKFGEFVVMVDTTDYVVDSATIRKTDNGYMMAALKTIRATAYIINSKLRNIGPPSITFNIKDAEISNDSYALVKLAYQIDSIQNYERIQEQQKQLEKHIQDSINNLRYSTFKPAK